MKYIRTNSLKRLFSLKRRSFDGDNAAVSPNGFTEESLENVVVACESETTKPTWRCFSFEEISIATNAFSSGLLHNLWTKLMSLACFCSIFPLKFWFWYLGFRFSFFSFFVENLVGRGGYAEVYKGVLQDGEEIAVKRLTKVVTDDRKEKEFLTEIGTIGHACHPNVLSLLGCCVDNGLYLIFQFSSRGSVASLFHGTKLVFDISFLSSFLIFPLSVWSLLFIWMVPDCRCEFASSWMESKA